MERKEEEVERYREKNCSTYSVAARDRTLHLFFPSRPTLARGDSWRDRALADHLQHRGALETMRTYAAADGDLHRAEGDGAIDADALGGHFDLIIIVIFVVIVIWSGGLGSLVLFQGRIVAGTGRSGSGEPGGGVRHGWSVVLWVTSVVDDFFEPDIVVVGGVPG